MNPRQLTAALESIHQATLFVASGKTKHAPSVRLKGLGVLPLPVEPTLLPALRAVGRPAPYGRGPDTIVDPSVRRCHQVDAADVEVSDAFARTLHRVVSRASKSLGVAGKVSARLYKLLIYGPGDFFVPHRDTEKETGMFGTLVVALPSEFTGGELHVSHQDQTEQISLQCSSKGARWTAFYADCTHEVKPLSAGVRVALVYNLIRDGAPTSPTGNPEVVHEVAEQLASWDGESPVKLAYILEHSYSEADLSWDRLKGADHGRANVLRDAALVAGVQVHLAQLAIDAQWSAEETQYRSRGRYGRRRGWGRWDDDDDDDDVPDDLAVYELIQEDRLLSTFIDVSDQPTSYEPMPLVEGEVWPEDAIDDEEPDEVSYYEATGNEGATLTRMYRRTAVVLWPADAADSLLVQRGLSAVVGVLLHEEDDARVARMVLRLIDVVQDGSSADVAALIDLLVEHELGDLAVRVVKLQYQLRRDVMGSVGWLLEIISEPMAADLVAWCLQKMSRWDPNEAMRLVQRMAELASEPSLWDAALDRAVELVPQWTMSTSAMVTLVHGAWALDHAGLQASLFALLDKDEAFDLGVGAAVSLHQQGLCPDLWLERVVSGLRERTVVAPVEPDSMRRARVTTCSCVHCEALSVFLHDRERRVLSYGVRKDRRSHLMAIVHSEGLDVSCQEVRTGSPHKIVFTKTKQRFEHDNARFKQHAQVLLELTGA